MTNLKFLEDKDVVSIGTNDQGEECIHFDPKKMKPSHVYQVVYQGKPYGLKKNKKSVSFMEFVPDE